MTAAVRPVARPVGTRVSQLIQKSASESHGRPRTAAKILGLIAQVIPEGAGPVKTNGCVCFCLFWSFLVLVGRVEVGVGVKARAEPDRVAAVGP